MLTILYRAYLVFLVLMICYILANDHIWPIIDLFGDLNDHLRGIKDSIGDHGDLIAGTITNQNILNEGEEANVLQTYDQIVTALLGCCCA